VRFAAWNEICDHDIVVSLLTGTFAMYVMSGPLKVLKLVFSANDGVDGLLVGVRPCGPLAKIYGEFPEN